MINTPTQRPWKVLLIHHTHTDIGYTQSQSRIARFHSGFLDQVLDIARRIREGDQDVAGFKWTNECFWSVEQWLKNGGRDRAGELAQCVREGIVELSATYMHFTELIDEPLTASALAKCVAFASEHGLEVESAMSADINGFSWGYSQALHDAGIQNLVTCVHSHHGLAPLGKRQTPFFWETPKGQEILVWNGEHYNLGNSMGLAPGAMLTYLFEDELNPASRQFDNYPVAAKRLPRYLRQLEIDGYPYDFVPMHISGAMTDNAPPSVAIIRFVKEWNALHGDSIQLQMSSLSELCSKVRDHPALIPRYRGDWPDWWSDGFASTPSETRMAREAMRSSHWIKQAASEHGLSEPKLVALEKNLHLYTEHTFNHSDSMSSPWDITTKAVGGNKRATAYAAYDAAMDGRDALFADLGEIPNTEPELAGERIFYKVINPTTEPMTDIVRLCLEDKDFERISFDPKVTDFRTGAEYPCVGTPAPRGLSFDLPFALNGGGEVTFELTAGNSTLSSYRRHFTERTSQGDVEGGEAVDKFILANANRIETPWLRLDFDENREIASLIDKQSGFELLNPNREHAPFTPIYEITPAGTMSMGELRRSFGRNRKGHNVQRSVGRPGVPHFSKAQTFRIPVEIEYTVEGTDWFKLLLFIWKDAPRIDATIRFHKTSVWEPENLYLSLPFAVPNAQLWLDKPGGAVRPWVDQLPDTLTDWYCIQEGFASCNSEFGLAMATPDAPLLQLGPLAHGKRLLMGHPELRPELARPYSWLMTNYWETNFEASLGGFHEFNYRFECGAHLADPEGAIRHCRQLNTGLKAFRVAMPEALP